MVTYEDVKNSEDIKTYIQKKNVRNLMTMLLKNA